MNNLWAYIGYEDDGHLLHTVKRTGAKRVSVQNWPDPASAKNALAAGPGKIEWEELKEPPPTAYVLKQLNAEQ